ncbi:MAG: hypothetical protein ACKVZ6_23485 [Kineosporiaceae bacterium]
MSNLTRAPAPVQARTPAWRQQVRETFPLPCLSAWMLAVVVVLGSGLVDLVFRSGW